MPPRIILNSILPFSIVLLSTIRKGLYSQLNVFWLGKLLGSVVWLAFSRH
jgi:hypothetical protein